MGGCAPGAGTDVSWLEAASPRSTSKLCQTSVLMFGNTRDQKENPHKKLGFGDTSTIQDCQEAPVLWQGWTPLLQNVPELLLGRTAIALPWCHAGMFVPQLGPNQRLCLLSSDQCLPLARRQQTRQHGATGPLCTRSACALRLTPMHKQADLAMQSSRVPSPPGNAHPCQQAPI